jgi:CubicO group peptidase (beta-lactamase class C family)
MTTLEAAIEDVLRSGLDEQLFSAAAAGVSMGSVRFVTALGTPAFDDPQPVTTSSVFDLASLTKPYVALTALALVDQNVLELDSPVAEHVQVGAGPGAGRITLRMLLRHTSGLPADSDVWRDPSISPPHRMAMVLNSNLVNAPDRRFVYSCPGYIAIGAIIESVTSAPLWRTVHSEVLVPLGLDRTRFGPVPSNDAVATEYEPWVGRGLVRGEVHDELCWYLGGETGNAGLFAPVDDVLCFAESFLKPGLLPERAWREMTSSSLTPSHGASFGHGLAVRIGDVPSMGSARGFGHTGFTGTLWIAEPERGWAIALLTNRVHPDRTAVAIAPFRKRFMDTVESFL